MSRVGRKPLPVPDKVDVSLNDTTLVVKGPKGTITTPLPRGIKASLENKTITFERGSNDGPLRALHGLARALAANAIHGVTQGFERRLEIVGVGFRAQAAGRKVTFSVGYSHPVEFEMPPGVDITLDDPLKVVVRGVDKQAVGQCAARIREIRPPDAYKGKGIRYAGETIKLKAGKAGSK